MPSLIPFSGWQIPFTGIIDAAYHAITHESKASHEWLHRLAASGKDKTEMAFNAIVLASLACTELTQGQTLHILSKS